MYSYIRVTFHSYRRNKSGKDGSINQPNYLNYGYTDPEEEIIFKKRKRLVLLMSLAIIIVFTGAAFGAGFGLQAALGRYLHYICNKQTIYIVYEITTLSVLPL